MNELNSTARNVPATTLFNNSDCIEAEPQTMSGEECLARFHQKLKMTENRALRNFNKLDDNFKFVVMTLANRANPGAFRTEEIGKPFEYFDVNRRKMIIIAMNEIARWGSILPRRFSIHECILAK
ncbi:hypothetical protein [Enterobacter hormaechei]|uniref:hypothetical protein n=1 Tax=Enterobacter hormaechei TaxID=158836 RepID=UPI00290A03D9|nr:hypothetical protein [Enterobacter hormaechei]